MTMAAYRERPTRGDHANDPAYGEHDAAPECVLCGGADVHKCPCPWRRPFDAWPRAAQSLLAGVLGR